MKIFRLNNCDWYMAPTLEEAIQCAVKDTGIDREYIVDDPRELTDEELDEELFSDEEAFWSPHGKQEHWECSCGEQPKLDRYWRWTGSLWEHKHHGSEEYTAATNRHVRTFRQELARRLEAGATTQFFASTEV